MLQTQALPMNQIASKGFPTSNKETKKNESNVDFLALVQSSMKQSKALEDFLNKTLKEDITNHPEFKELLEGMPINIVSEFKQLIGQPLKQIMSDENISTESKILSLIATTINAKTAPSQLIDAITKHIDTPLMNLTEGKENKVSKTLTNLLLEGKNNPTLEKIISSLLSETKVTLSKVALEKPINEGRFIQIPLPRTPQEKDGTKQIPSNAISPGALGKSRELTNLNNLFRIPGITETTQNNVNLLPMEGQTYGEFKLDKSNSPIVLQVSVAETPEKTQQDFMKQIETILKSSRFNQIAKNQSQMTIQLKPHNLGFMTIKIEQINQEIVARIITSSAATKDLIESNLNQLRHLNIQVDKFDILTNQTNNDMLRDQKDGREQQDQQEKDPNGSHDKEKTSKSFEEQLEDIALGGQSEA